MGSGPDSSFAARRVAELTGAAVAEEGRGESLLREAVEVANRSGDPLLLAEARVQLARCLTRSQGSPEALEQLREASELLEGLPQDRPTKVVWTDLYRVLGNTLERLSRYDEALDAHDRCLKAAIETGDQAAEQAALGNLGYSYYQQGDGVRAIKYSVLAIEHPAQNRTSVACAYGSLGSAYEALGQGDLALQCFEQAAEYFDLDMQGRVTCLLRMAIASAALGEVAGGLAQLEEAEELIDRFFDDVNETPMLPRARAALASAQGEAEEAQRWCVRALQAAQEWGEAQEEVRAGLLLAQLRQDAGDFAGSLEVLAEIDSTSLSFGYRHDQLRLMAEAHKALGDWELAYRALEERHSGAYVPVSALEEAVRDARQQLSRSEGLERSNYRLERERAIIEKDRDEITETVKGIAHDLRSPLTVGILCLETMAAGARAAGADNKVEDRLRQAHKALKQVGQIAGEFDRVGAALPLPDDGPAEVVVAPPGTEPVTRVEGVDLVAEVRRCVELAEPLAESKDQTIITVLPEREPLALVTSSVVSRVVLNLLTNAVKYSPFGATTTVQVASTEEGWAEVTVTDEGQGLTEDDLARVFQEAKQLSARPTAGEESNGIGLHASARLMESVGGTIEVTSDGRDHGSTFRARFPLVRPEAAPVRTPTSMASQNFA